MRCNCPSRCARWLENGYQPARWRRGSTLSSKPSRCLAVHCRQEHCDALVGRPNMRRLFNYFGITPLLAKVRSLAAQRTCSELIAQNDDWIRVCSWCFFVGLLGSAGIGAVQHRVPVFGPCLAPRHGAPAHGAELAGQRLFIAFEVAFHRWGFAVQANRSPCPDGLGGASTLRLGAALRPWPEGGKPLFREPWRASTAPASSRDCCV